MATSPNMAFTASRPFHVVILGGYGNFGARIAKRLAGQANLAITIAGRNHAAATRFCQTLNNQAPNQTVNAACLDMDSPDFVAALAALNPHLLIHTAGPFQTQNYRIAQTAAEVGAHYIDLADGRRFVCDFADALHARFSQVGRIAISGASTVPALSSAVINHLADSFSHINTIDICIAPAQTAPRGVATLAAVLDYCGEPIQLFNNGRWITAYGWSQPSKVQFARMPPRYGALCDIPDLELFPTRYAGVQTVMFRAALEVKLSQYVFAALAYLRRKHLTPNLRFLAAPMQRSAKWFDTFGSALGGMVVNVKGLDAQGKPITRAWHIAADHDHGPEIPAMPAILLTKKLANGEIPRTGAYSCMDFLTLTDFMPEFAHWQMQTDII